MDKFEEQLLSEREILLKRLEGNTDYQRLKFIEDYIAKFTGNSEINDTSEFYKPSQSSIFGDGFPVGGRRLEQISYILKQEKRFMHVTQISKAMHKYLGALKLEDIKRKVSIDLSKARREGIGSFERIKVDNSNQKAYWGSKSWLKEDNTPKDQFMYIELEKTKSTDVL